MEKQMSIHRKTLVTFGRGINEGLAVTVLLSLVIFCMTFSIIARHVPVAIISKASHMVEEVGVFAFIWFIYWGAIIATQKDAHFKITTQFDFMPKSLKKFLLLTGEVLWLIFNIFIIKLGWDLVVSGIGQKSISVEAPMWFIYAVIPVCFILISVRLIQNISRRLKFYKNQEGGRNV